jgi:hypothetical protein
MALVRMGRVARRAAALLVATMACGLMVAGSAWATTYSWSVAMSGSQVVPAVPGVAANSGTASLSADTATNRICGTFSWSTGGTFLAAHIHQGQAGQPENPLVTINLVTPSVTQPSSPVSGCALVPGPVIAEMARFPQLFNVELHTVQFPAGAMRGQLGSGTLTCELGLCPGPVSGTPNVPWRPTVA